MTDEMNLQSRYIADIQISYRYLGISQLHGNHDEIATTSIKINLRQPAQ